MSINRREFLRRGGSTLLGLAAGSTALATGAIGCRQKTHELMVTPNKNGELEMKLDGKEIPRETRHFELNISTTTWARTEDGQMYSVHHVTGQPREVGIEAFKRAGIEVLNARALQGEDGKTLYQLRDDEFIVIGRDVHTMGFNKTDGPSRFAVTLSDRPREAIIEEMRHPSSPPQKLPPKQENAEPLRVQEIVEPPTFQELMRKLHEQLQEEEREGKTEEVIQTI